MCVGVNNFHCWLLSAPTKNVSFLVVRALEDIIELGIIGNAPQSIYNRVNRIMIWMEWV